MERFAKIRKLVLQLSANKYTNMKLSAVAIEKINETPIRLKLALFLGVTERWVSQLIRDNAENGDLTKAGSIELIQSETGLTDVEILEKDTVEANK